MLTVVTTGPLPGINELDTYVSVVWNITNSLYVANYWLLASFLSETSVADRRRMFELAASRVGGGAPQNATSRPDLRQLQHDALAEYVERKRSVKRDDGGHRSAQRPQSAYLQPDNSNRTGECKVGVMGGRQSEDLSY